MSMRRLLAIFVALSMLFTPAVTGAAMAASADHDMQMLGAGHCQASPSGHADHKNTKHGCCIAMCTALAVAPSTPLDTASSPQRMTGFALPRTYQELPLEIATPPPRRS